MDIKFFNFLTNKSSSDDSFFVLIDNKIFINELLKQIFKSRKSVRIFVGSEKKVFKTFLSDVDSDSSSKSITTEYISFLNLYKSRFTSSHVILVFKHKDTYYGFKAEFIGFVNKNQLKLGLPSHVYKLQRREYVRVKQSIKMPIRVSIAPYYKDDFKDKLKDFIDFWELEKQILYPSIVDISEGGVSLVIHSSNDSLDQFSFPIFRMKLSVLNKDISVIARAASVVSLPLKDNKYRYRIGFAFRNISNNNRSIIKEYIMERQSEILRNRKRNL